MNDNYKWEENQDGSVTITDYTGNGGDVVIPSEIDGKSVTSIGDGAFMCCTGLTSVTIPDSVTSIGDRAFEFCDGLTVISVDKNNKSYTSEDGVLFDKNKTTLMTYPEGKKGAYTIPDSVTKIGYRAFSDCAGLTNVTIPDSVKSIGRGAFVNCIELKNITIPDSVTSISSLAFYNCTGLTNIIIPTGVIEMENEVFYKCDNVVIHGYKNSYAETYANENGLTFAEINIKPTDYYKWRKNKNGGIEITNYIGNGGNIIIPSKIYGKPVTTIGNSAFYNCKKLTSVIIPKSVTLIKDYAFYGCGELTSIDIPDSITEINDEAFAGCKKLTNITIPDGVIKIGSAVFSNCVKLKNITIPNSVKTIGDLAFNNCTELTDVTISNNVTSIGNSAFFNCMGLTSINVDENNKNYTSKDGVLFNKDKTNLIVYPQAKKGAYTIPNSITKINANTFCNCKELTSIIIPNSVTKIDHEAFAGCTGLTNITISNGVTEIGTCAFSNCKNLTNITIPDSVTSIDNRAFVYNCTELTSINVDENNKNYTSEDGVLFNKDKTTLIICPARKKDSYTIPNGVTTISDYAFSNCTELTNIIIPDSVTEIKNLAFYNCTGLTDITVPDSVTKIGAFIFDECNNLNIHGHKNSCIEVYANRNKIYANKNKIAFVEINTKTVKDYKWQENEDDGVTITNYIGNDSNIIIPSEINNKPVTSISVDAFSFLHCKELTSITIPDSIVSINNPAFINCLKLTSINVDKNNKNYSSKDGVLFCKDKSANLTVLMVCPACKKGVYTIPDGVKAINEYAFFYCKELTDIIIPDSVVSIDDLAFNNCVKPPIIHSSKNSYIETYANKNKIPFVVTNTGVIDNYEWIENQDGSLTIEYYVGSNNDIIVPSKINGKPVTAIGDCAFEDCTELTNVIIPDSINDIGEYAFAGCSKLKSITIPDSVSIIEDNSFDKCNNLIIYSCKNSCAEDYANENKIPFVVADTEWLQTKIW